MNDAARLCDPAGQISLSYDIDPGDRNVARRFDEATYLDLRFSTRAAAKRVLEEEKLGLGNGSFVVRLSHQLRSVHRAGSPIMVRSQPGRAAGPPLGDRRA